MWEPSSCCSRKEGVNLNSKDCIGGTPLAQAAANGHEAVRVAQLLTPDLIVLDLAMPVMDGLDAAECSVSE